MRNILKLLLVLMLPVAALAADGFEASSAYFDSQGRYTVEVDVPAGARHAVLESHVQGPPMRWKNLVSGALDGRAARVIFRVPAGFSTKEILRVKTGPETTVPAAQLNDPTLYTVIYESGLGEQVKLDFLRDASAKMREWASLPRAEYQARLIGWAHTKPLVAVASVSMPADNVAIRFTDGDVCVLLNKQRDSETLVPESAPAGTYRTETEVSRKFAAAAETKRSERGPEAPFAESLGLPASNRAVTAHSLEAFFPDSAPTIGNWLASSGYSVKKVSGTTVDEVKSWFSSGSLGVLFWHVHGCSYEKDGVQSVGLVTRQFASVALSQGAYKAMRDSGELALAIDRGQTVPYYVITPTFVRKYMRFAANSLVVIDACHGTNADLAQAFIDSGAGSYVSWDWESGKRSGESCRKIFDRMLGMNQESPISTVKERSFSQPIVETWMWQQGYEFDPSPKYPGQTRSNAQLIWRQHPLTPAYVLKPTIIRILNQVAGPDQRFSALMIEGNFGEDPGSGQRNVIWGGQVLPVLRWEGADRIYVRVPNPAPVGGVQVVVSRGFVYDAFSNEVPITEWAVPFTWNFNEAGSLSEKMVMRVKFRADLRGERIYPEAPVVYQNTSFWCIADCTGTMSAAGTYSPMEGVTLSYHGGSTMKSFDLVSDHVPEGHMLTNSGTMRGNGSFSAFHLRASGAYEQTYTYVLPDGGTFSQTVPAASSFDGASFFAPLPSFNPVTFVLGAGNKTISEGASSSTLSWPATTPAAIPTAETPR